MKGQFENMFTQFKPENLKVKKEPAIVSQNSSKGEQSKQKKFEMEKIHPVMNEL